MFYQPISLIMKSIANLSKCVKYLHRNVGHWNKLPIDFTEVLLGPKELLQEFYKQCLGQFLNIIHIISTSTNSSGNSLGTNEGLRVSGVNLLKSQTRLSFSVIPVKFLVEFLLRLSSEMFQDFLKNLYQSLDIFQSPQHFYHGNSDSFPWIPPADLG